MVASLGKAIIYEFCLFNIIEVIKTQKFYPNHFFYTIKLYCLGLGNFLDQDPFEQVES